MLCAVHHTVWCVHMTMAKSPKHVALWSHPSGFGATTISTPLLGCFLAVFLAVEMGSQQHGERLLSSHNGLLMKFFKVGARRSL